MPDAPTAGRKAFGDIAPALADYTDKVLFGDVWERPGLSKRDRSLITVATLVALYRTNELPFHLKRALDNGVSRDELIELITHLAFYAGWPAASSAVTIARRVFEEQGADPFQAAPACSGSDKDSSLSCRNRGFSRFHGLREQPAKASNPEDYLSTWVLIRSTSPRDPAARRPVVRPGDLPRSAAGPSSRRRRRSSA